MPLFSPDVSPRMAVALNDGDTVGTRRQLDVIEGTGVSLTVVDDGANDRVQLTIASTAVGYTLADATTTVLGGVLIDAAPISGDPIALTVPRLGAASGVAQLDSGGVVPTAQLPADVAYTDVANDFTTTQSIDVGGSDEALDITSFSGTALTATSVTGRAILANSTSGDAGYFVTGSGHGLVGGSTTGVGIYAGSEQNTALHAEHVGSLIAATALPTFAVVRGGITASTNVYTGPLIFGNDAPTGTADSSGPLVQLQHNTTDAFIVDNLGKLTVVSGSMPSNGQLLIGDGAGFSVASLTAGANVTITPGAGSITIGAALPGDVAYTDVDNSFSHAQTIKTGLSLDGSATLGFVSGLKGLMLGFTQDTTASGPVVAINPNGRMTASALTQYAFEVEPIIAQTGTAGFDMIRVDPTVSSTGSGVKNLLNLRYSGDRFQVDTAGKLKIVSGSTPTNGQLLIGDGAGFSLASLTAGANVTITPGSGTIQIAASGGASTTKVRLTVVEGNSGDFIASAEATVEADGYARLAAFGLYTTHDSPSGIQLRLTANAAVAVLAQAQNNPTPTCATSLVLAPTGGTFTPVATVLSSDTSASSTIGGTVYGDVIVTGSVTAPVTYMIWAQALVYWAG